MVSFNPTFLLKSQMLFPETYTIPDPLPPEAEQGNFHKVQGSVLGFLFGLHLQNQQEAEAGGCCKFQASLGRRLGLLLKQKYLSSPTFNRDFKTGIGRIDLTVTMISSEDKSCEL